MDFRDWQRMNPSGFDHHDPDYDENGSLRDEEEESV